MVLWSLGIAFICFPSAFWLLGLIRWRLRARSSNQSQPGGVSVLVAARNEEKNVTPLLTAILGQRPEPPEQVILVDDQSSDLTAEIASDFRTKSPQLTVLHASPGPANVGPKKHALQQGLALIDQPWVAMTDADCLARDRWLHSLSRETDEDTGVVLGASFPPEGNGITELMYRAERLTANCVMASSCGWGLPSSACGHNILYRTEALRSCGGFAHPELPSGDDDLTVQAIAKKGWKAVFSSSPESVVEDRGGFGRNSRWHSAARHQSVLAYYPLGWRVLFAWSIIAHLAALAISGHSLLSLDRNAWLIISIGVFILDAVSGILLAKSLRLNIKFFEIVLGAVFLPAWLLWRASASLFGGSFKWRGRNFETRQTSGVCS